MYVLDTNVISMMHKHYYRSRFVSLWKQFDALVHAGKITSTREVLQELNDGVGPDTDWANANAKLFATPDAKEAKFVTQIFSVPQFLTNIERKKIIQGGHNADAFIVARAFAVGGTVVTKEKFKPGGSKVPNICKHFDIPYEDIEGFMEKEGWTF